MNAMAPTRQSVRRRSLRTSLTTGPAAPAEARCFVRKAIEAWGLPADPYVAALLTSELVTNAIRHERGESVKLFVTCYDGHLRVYVHDTARVFPALIHAPIDAEAGRGLMLVSSLSTDWGYCRTPDGKVVYFTLSLGAESEAACDHRDATARKATSRAMSVRE